MSPFAIFQVGILRDGEAAGLVSGDDAESARLTRALRRGSFLFSSTNGERPAHGRTGQSWQEPPVSEEACAIVLAVMGGFVEEWESD